MKKISIIIVNYHGGEMVAQLKQSLDEEEKSLSGIKIEIIVIDNNKKNIGFAAGCNKGIRLALKNGAEAVLLMNQDVEVGRGFIKSLLDNPADIVSPVIKFQREDKWIYDYGGKINWWLGRTHHEELISVHLGGVMASQVQPARSSDGAWPATSEVFKKIDYVSGCCMLIKRRVFEKIGLLDERFFMYFEDVDFCLRAAKANYKIRVESRSVIIHNLSEGKRKSVSQRIELIKSNLIFINQYLGWKKMFGYPYLAFLMMKILLSGLE